MYTIALQKQIMANKIHELSEIQLNNTRQYVSIYICNWTRFTKN